MPEKPKYLSENGLAYLWQGLKGLLGNKVDKETGKGLSTNDFSTTEKEKLNNIQAGANVNIIESIKVNDVTQGIDNKTVNISVPTQTSQLTNNSNFAVDAAYVHTDNNYTTTEKDKLAGIEASADVNIIESISVNGTAQTVTNKGVNIAVPTNNNQLANGAGYQTSSDVSSAIAAAIQDITSFEFSIVNSLPATGVKGTIYLVAHAHGDSDGYDEFIWVNNTFEKLGHVDIDLSGYMQTTDTITNAEIDQILAT